MSDLKTQYHIQSLQSALDVLEAFTLQERQLGISDISRKLGMNKSRVHRILVTLENSGYVNRNEETQKYRLGLKLFQLGHIVEEQMEVRHSALPVMKELALETEETINLNVIHDGHRMSVEKIESPHEIRQAVELGKTLPLYSGAPGKVLLANLPEAKRNEIIHHVVLQRMGPRTITDPEKLHTELEKVREVGYSVSFEETYLGAVSIAAPVRNFSGTVIAAISITGPVSRFSTEKIDKFIPLAIRAGKVISKALGFEDKG